MLRNCFKTHLYQGNHFARGYGTTIFVFKKAKVDIDARIEKEIEEKRFGH
jgi:hypothetical protein